MLVSRLAELGINIHAVHAILSRIYPFNFQSGALTMLGAGASFAGLLNVALRWGRQTAHSNRECMPETAECTGTI